MTEERLTQENENLRALLREAKSILIAYGAEHENDFYTRIDAALGEGK